MEFYTVTAKIVVFGKSQADAVAHVNTWINTSVGQQVAAEVIESSVKKSTTAESGAVESDLMNKAVR